MPETDINLLLSNLSPVLSKGKYYFGSFAESEIMVLANYLDYITAIFREEEGITAIFLEDAKADLSELSKPLEGPFALITLSVNSDLFAVGFLAKISTVLAENGISCNAVSAYHHDHIFVPYKRKNDAIKALKELSKK